MDVLTADELEVLNNASRVLLSTVSLGDLVEELASRAGEAATPVNAVAAGIDLTFAGVVEDGETVTIGSVDVYEFCADAVQSVAAPSNIAMDITGYTTPSVVTLTIDTQPLSGDTMLIGSKTFTFVPNTTANADGEVSVGTDLATAQVNIVDAINGTDGHNDPHPLCTAAAFGADDSVITALIGGTLGDAYVSTETFDEVTNVFSTDVFASGADCVQADAVTAVAAAVTASDTQGVGAVDGAGDVVEFTADVAGVLGNAITCTEACANGSFAGAAVLFVGGIDGTVAPAGSVRADASYIYVPSADNTVADANWCRASIASF